MGVADLMGGADLMGRVDLLGGGEIRSLVFFRRHSLPVGQAALQERKWRGSRVHCGLGRPVFRNGSR